MFLEDIGFSLWADFIERDFLESGFRELISKNIVNGATSNPAIFKEAILNSPAYKEQLSKLTGTPKKKYEALAVTDIKRACEILLPLYEKGDEGFASLEVDPRLCNDAKGTVEEALRLHKAVDMPNLMIKVPATEAGYEAMEELIGRGINVNATLIFSPSQAKGCLDAFKRGFQKDGSPKAVLSIFVSRFDRKLDKMLPDGLQGRVGIMNAAKIYNLINSYNLPNAKALFASTGVKGDEYPPHYYISELLAPNSVNTAPIKTIEAFVEHGDKEPKLPIPDEKIATFFNEIADNGIDMQKVYDELLEEGLEAFVKAFDEILKELS